MVEFVNTNKQKEIVIDVAVCNIYTGKRISK